MEKSKVYCTECGSENQIDSNYCYECGNKLFRPNDIELVSEQEENDDSETNEDFGDEEFESIPPYKPNRPAVLGWILLLVGCFVLLISFSIRPNSRPVDLSLPSGTLGNGIIEKSYNIQSDYEYNKQKIEYDRKTSEANFFLFAGISCIVASFIIFAKAKSKQKETTDEAS